MDREKFRRREMNEPPRGGSGRNTNDTTFPRNATIAGIIFMLFIFASEVGWL